MVIRTNKPALNTLNNLTKTNSALAGSIEKLSSGYRINRAADDNAGLAISERMRSQIRGLETAAFNAENGNTLISTGEGALDEVHAMLVRLKDLAVESANGTMRDELDREALQKELEEICGEIDRIATSTKYNGIHLFQDYGRQFEYLSSAYWDTSGLFSSRLDSGETALITYKDGGVFASLPSDPTNMTYIGTEDLFAPNVLSGSDEQVAQALKQQMQTVNDYGQQEYRESLAQMSLEQTSMEQQTVATSPDDMTIDELIASTAEDETNIVYTEFNVQTTQTPAGSANNPAEYPNFKNVLQTQIIPNVVNGILDKYGTAFSYLRGSTIGMGLTIENNPQSSVLASVSNRASNNFMEYTLTVNVGRLSFVGGTDTLTDASRKSLESTIAHEMIHAFMFEATSSGMFGHGGQEFPMWFIEGMAQTASGAGNWVSAGLRLSANSSIPDIRAALLQSSTPSGSALLSDSASSALAQYGTGYLACMYIGYLQAGANSVDANTIASGISTFLDKIVQGASLDRAFIELGYSGGITEFQNRFATSYQIHGFVQSLLGAIGNGFGGVVSGDLTSTDLVPDNNATVNLFELDPAYTTIRNVYPNGYDIFTGGTANTDGAPPSASTTFPDGLFTIDGVAIGSTTTAGTGWSYDASNGELKITGSGSFNISGGTLNGNVGRIVVADNISGNVNITFDGIDIDKSSARGQAAFSTGKGNNVIVNLAAGSENNLASGLYRAGMEIEADSTLTIDGAGKLTATGGGRDGNGKECGAGIGGSSETSGHAANINSKLIIKGGEIHAYSTARGGTSAIGSASEGGFGDIIITDGKINAISGAWGSCIGAGAGGSCGDITISGGDIYASGDALGYEGATGIGAGDKSNGNKSKCGKITISGTGNIEIQSASAGSNSAIGTGAGICDGIEISGNVNIVAIAGKYGCGIGGGGQSTVNGDIVINGGNIIAIGGSAGAGIGCGLNSSMTGNVVINGGNITASGGQYGAGIGSGSNGHLGDVIITGGIVKATGGSTGAGIGSGYSGTTTGIKLTGGVISAFGGQPDGRGNIAAYSDRGHTITSTILIGRDTTIRAGTAGEGLYNTSGASDASGNGPVYSYPLPITGAVASIQSIGTITRTAFSWSAGTSHSPHDNSHAYIWMMPEDQMVTVTYDNGDVVTYDLVWHQDREVWRLRNEPDPPDPVDPEEPVDPVDPDKGGNEGKVYSPQEVVEIMRYGYGGIVLQVGAKRGEIMVVPQFYLSVNALKMDTLDISHQQTAMESITTIDNAVSRVSMMRAEYGALQNRLGHTVDNLNTSIENLTDAESRIRDVDMAKEYTKLLRMQVLAQAGQSMLVQSNTQPQRVLELLQ